jgi:hypothetical protein
MVEACLNLRWSRNLGRMGDFPNLVQTMSANRNWAGYFLWWADFVTQFQQGCVRGTVPGLGTGSVLGGAAALSGVAPGAPSIAIVGGAGWVSNVLSNGLVNAVVWARQNEIPNPFRPPPPSSAL